MQIFSRMPVPPGLCLVVTAWTRTRLGGSGPGRSTWTPHYRIGAERYLTPERARLAAAAAAAGGEAFAAVDAAVVLHYDPETSLAEVVPVVPGALPDTILGLA